MNLRMLILAALPVLMFMFGCGQSSDLAYLNLTNKSSAVFSFRVEPRSWPSRWVYFEPTKAAGMRAYSEPVYTSLVDIRVTNDGTSACSISYLAKQQRIAPKETLELKGVKFAEIRLNIAPAKDKNAEITMELAFDRPYSTTDSWRLVGVWSDGP